MNDATEAFGSDPHPIRMPSTQWSLVVSAGDRSTDQSRSALEKLCRAYWKPLYAYARRRADEHEAQDLTQAFFERLLDKNYLAQADPARGRFRAFLITAFKHFLSNQWDKQRALKRGGAKLTVPLHFSEAATIEPETTLTAEQIFDQQWAVTLLDRVLQRLQREFRRAGKAEQFDVLSPFVTAGSSTVSYTDAAQRLNLSEPGVRMAASRMRKRYRELLRVEISNTITDPSEVDDELRHLFSVFAM